MARMIAMALTMLAMAAGAVRAQEPIDISAAANMGFADEVEGDRQGGWTDQGRVNDLRTMPVGRQRYGKIEFEVIDPNANGGRSCLIFAGPEREYFLKQADIPVNGQSLKFLYLLHGSAWTPKDASPIGTIRVAYADGTDQTIEIIAKRDLDDWWIPFPVANGAVVWTSDNNSAYVGLYASKFALEGKPVEKLTLTGSGKSVWAVVAITGSEDDLALPESSGPHMIVQNDDWQPIENLKTIEPDSVMDFSFLNEAPAGQHGRVVVRDGRFEFKNLPGRRVRLFGPNLCYELCYPSKQDAELLAQTLHRMGYNAVRLQHFDVTLTPDPAKARSDEPFDLERLDRLEYLIACLKKHGVYVTFDLYTQRGFSAEDCPEFGREFREEIGGLVYLSATAREAWARWARALLTRRNPYTDMNIAEDPVFWGAAPLNENWICTYEGMFPLYEKGFTEWAEQHKLTWADAEARQADFIRYLTELQIRTDEQLKAVLRDIGYAGPVSGVNHYEMELLTLNRSHLDYVDNHAYWNHPAFFSDSPWGIPWKQMNGSSALARGAVNPRVYFPTRILGKPFTVTEFNYCYPNVNRGEGGPLMGAYAGLQDWDGLMRFDFGHDADEMTTDKVAYVFGAVHDPINRLAERIIALQFLRGDVRPADKALAYVVSEDTIYRAYRNGRNHFADDFRSLGLAYRIGSVNAADAASFDGRYAAAVGWPGSGKVLSRTKFYPWDPTLIDRLTADGVIDKAHVDAAAGRFASDTGQLKLDAKAETFQAVTPNSEAFIILRKGELAGERVRVANDGQACTVMVAAVDGQPIAESRRLLVLHLTDVQNDRIKFRSRDLTVLEHIGQLPHLVRRGTAEISIKLEDPGAVEVWAVDLSGKRQKKMETRVADGAVTFTAATVQPEGTFLAYEIERQP